MPRVLASLAAAVAVTIIVGAVARAEASGPALNERGWVWPVTEVQVTAPYVAPAHAYGPGHRGIDLAANTALRAPADGTIAFAGAVAGRGVLTIDHGDGLVTTLEPVTTGLSPGDAVTRSQPVATPDAGGHAVAGSIHFGVRLSGEYINPMLLLGGVPRAVLLPCC